MTSVLPCSFSFALLCVQTIGANAFAQQPSSYDISAECSKTRFSNLTVLVFTCVTSLPYEIILQLYTCRSTVTTISQGSSLYSFENLCKRDKITIQVRTRLRLPKHVIYGSDTTLRIRCVLYVVNDRTQFTKPPTLFRRYQIFTFGRVNFIFIRHLSGRQPCYTCAELHTRRCRSGLWSHQRLVDTLDQQK